MKNWGMFWLLGLIWGSSFLLIKIAVDELGPLPLVAVRIGLAALVIQPDAMMAFTALPVQTIRAASALGLVTLAGGLWALSRNQTRRTIWRWTFWRS